MAENDDLIVSMFTYHPPKGDQPERYQQLRDKARQLAFMIDDFCPASLEKTEALTKLSEVSMWTNAAIARNE